MLSKNAIRDLEFEVAHLRESYPKRIEKYAKSAAKKRIDALNAYHNPSESVRFDVFQSVTIETMKDQPDIEEAFNCIDRLKVGLLMYLKLLRWCFS